MVNTDVKNAINTMYMVCDVMNESYNLGTASIRDIMRMDFLKFILYLGASDNEISPKEVEFIETYLDWDLSISQWNEFIDDQNLRSDSILNDIPLTFKFFVDADNKAYARDNSIMNAAEKYISIFAMLGDLFVESDNKVDKREQIALVRYVSMLQTYYEKNSNRIIVSKKIKEDNSLCIELDERIIKISKALPETIRQMQELVVLRNEIVKQLEKIRDNYDPDDSMASPDNFAEKLYEILVFDYDEKYNDKFNEKYGYSFHFSPNWEYLNKFRNVCRLATDKITEAYKYQTSMREFGHSIAESEAYKEIKGMPFGIITNRLSSALLYSGMSAMTYASQVKKAEQTYDRIMSKYNDSGAAQKEMQILITSIFPLIHPVAEKCTAYFFDDVMKTVDECEKIGYANLEDKHKTCKLVSDDQYAYGDTIALREALNNLEKVSNDDENYNKILTILESCPYCPEVYLKLIKIGKFDERVFGIAKTMHIDKMILPELQKEVDKRKTNVNDVKPILKIIALYKSKSYEQILKNTYQSTINRIQEEYHQLFLLCEDNKKIDRWIFENIDSDMDKVVVTTEECLKDKIDLWICENINDSEFADLANMNLISIGDVRMKDSSAEKLEDVKKEYIAKMLSHVVEYIEEAKKRKVAYQDAYDKFNAELLKRNTFLGEAKLELKQQGLLAFSKKKEIKAKIERLQSELKEFEMTEPVKLKEAYYNMYS